jgi:hypothetical protein
MKHYFTLIILIPLIVGCGTSTVLINEKYTGQQNTKKDMVIFPIFYETFTVQNWDDVIDDFDLDSANCTIFIYDTLSKSLLHNSKSCTRNLIIKDGTEILNWYNLKKDPNNYFTINKKINDKYLTDFQIPKKEFFDSAAVDSAYALIINKLVIGRNVERQVSGGMYVPGQTVSTPGGTFTTPGTFSPGWSMENLGAITEFIIWDYEKNDFVKCGQIVTKEEFPFGMTTGTWLSLFKAIPEDLFDDTPMGVTTLNYYQKK